MAIMCMQAAATHGPIVFRGAGVLCTCGQVSDVEKALRRAQSGAREDSIENGAQDLLRRSLPEGTTFSSDSTSSSGPSNELPPVRAAPLGGLERCYVLPSPQAQPEQAPHHRIAAGAVATDQLFFRYYLEKELRSASRTSRCRNVRVIKVGLGFKCRCPQVHSSRQALWLSRAMAACT